MKMDNAITQLSGKRILVTGGAGFIGSNLVGALLKGGVEVTVLDDLSTGKKENLDDFFENSKFHFIEGDITDFDTCLKAMQGIDAISHQAALGSVPRSIELLSLKRSGRIPIHYSLTINSRKPEG